jgi:hypothetical protein
MNKQLYDIESEILYLLSNSKGKSHIYVYKHIHIYICMCIYIFVNMDYILYIHGEILQDIYIYI